VEPGWAIGVHAEIDRARRPHGKPATITHKSIARRQSGEVAIAPLHDGVHTVFGAEGRLGNVAVTWYRVGPPLLHVRLA